MQHNLLGCSSGNLQTNGMSQARFKRRATGVPNSTDPIKLDFSTAVARLGFKRSAIALPNSIRKL